MVAILGMKSTNKPDNKMSREADPNKKSSSSCGES